jgi:hypothetical protein
MSETRYHASKLVVGPYGQPVVTRGYTEIGSVRIYDGILVVGKYGQPEISRGGIWFEGCDDTSNRTIPNQPQGRRDTMSETDWQPIETAPRDGTPFLVWANGYEWPEVMRWFDYPPEEVEEIGELGYFHYAEELMRNVCDTPEMDEFSHWMPITPPTKGTTP